MKNNVYVTPIGNVKFPTTIYPDLHEFGGITIPAEYKKGDKYAWKIGLSFDPKEGAEIIKIIAEAESKIKGRNFSVVKKDKKKDPDTGEIQETGLALINFKSFFKPIIVDSKKNPVTKDITWGSRVRISFSLGECDFKNKKGITCYMKGIQVVELGESDSASFFGEIEEGYVSETIKSNENKPLNPEDINWED